MDLALAFSNHRSSSPLSPLRLTTPLSVQHPSPLKLHCPTTTSLTPRNMNLPNLDSRVFPVRCYRRRGEVCLSMAEANCTPSDFQDETFTIGFVKEMIADFKNGNPLDKKYVHQILEQTRDLFLPLPSVVDICVPDGKHLTVCDDLHGQLNGLPSEDNPYIFNGEFVNTGDLSVEVLLTLFALKCMCPSAIYLTGTTHNDDEHMNKVYGFEREVNSKLGEEFLQHFVEVFHWFPLAYVINNKITVLGDCVKPCCKVRGLNYIFMWEYPGPALRWRSIGITSDCINKLELRSEGYGVEHDGKTIIVFSASNYYKVTFPTKDLVQEIMVFAEQVFGWIIICSLVGLAVIGYFPIHK